MRNLGRLPAALFLSFLCLIQACTSLQLVEHSENRDLLLQQISVGDTVRVTTKSGEEHVFEVTSISREKIAGGDEAFVLDDVAKVERKSFSYVQTGLLLLTIVGVIAVLNSIANTAEDAGNSVLEDIFNGIFK